MQVFQLTAARRRLGVDIGVVVSVAWFQLTAARRRLGAGTHLFARNPQVSTHSRPKAAGKRKRGTMKEKKSFNSQPPEGGWEDYHVYGVTQLMFQLTAARRRLARRHSYPLKTA